MRGFPALWITRGFRQPDCDLVTRDRDLITPRRLGPRLYARATNVLPLLSRRIEGDGGGCLQKLWTPSVLSGERLRLRRGWQR